MKKKGFSWLIALLAIIVLPLLLLNNNKFQHSILQHYLKSIALEYNLEPAFESFQLYLDKNSFIQFKGFRLSDSLGQCFLTADRLDINLKTMPLIMNGQLDVNELRLIGTKVQLNKLYKDSPMNIAYLKKIFKSVKSRT